MSAHLDQLVEHAKEALDSFHFTRDNATAEVGTGRKHFRPTLAHERERAIHALVELAVELAVVGYRDAFLPLGELSDGIRDGYSVQSWSLRVVQIVALHTGRAVP